MLFLFLAICFGSLFSVVFKVCQKKDIDTSQVILFNYVTAIAFSAGGILLSIAGGNSSPSDYALDTPCVLLALLQGSFFFLGFFVMNRSTWRSGVALTTAAARSSLILPLILSWLLLSQTEPSWLCVALIIIAMLLMVLPSQSEKREAQYRTDISEGQRRVKTMLALSAVFLTYGVSDFLLKLVQNSVETRALTEQMLQSGLAAQKTIIFSSAALFSLASCLVSGSFRKDGKRNRTSLHQGFRWRNVLGGVVLGLVNTGCTTCVLLALSRISTSLYFPLYNIGIVVVATLVGVIFFKEKLRPLQTAGLALAAAAIALSFIL